jgi:hypothetical protein
MTSANPAPAFEARDPAWRRRVERGFAEAPFVHENGIRLVDCGPGRKEST